MKYQVPVERRKDITYGSYNCDYKPNKEEKWRTWLTTGGDRINYPDNCGTLTADMLLFKILLNSIVSTKRAKCLMIDIKDFYLNTPMKIIWVYATLNIRVSRQNYKRIQIGWNHDSRWIYILWNTKRDVRLTSSWDNSLRTPWRRSCQTWIHAEQNNTWSPETQNQTNMLHPGGRQLCNKIHLWTRCRTLD